MFITCVMPVITCNKMEPASKSSTKNDRKVNVKFYEGTVDNCSRQQAEVDNFWETILELLWEVVTRTNIKRTTKACIEGPRRRP